MGRHAKDEDALERTRTFPEDVGAGAEGDELVVRWVFPMPAPPPTWLDQLETTLGRGSGNSVELNSAYVSRVHARITRSGPFHVLTDASTKNGISVDGERVTEAVISDGSVLRIGDFVGVCVRAPRQAELGCAPLLDGIFGGRLHRPLVARLLELAATGLPIVLEGETGTGKEVFARSLHQASGRLGPLLAYNCALYSKSTGPAELFGYRKGAFTGAEQSSLGHVRAAEGGTLMLDEVLDLSLEMQATLLRVLENHEVLPLGEIRPVPVDIRVLTSTQKSLEQAVAEGHFRADLRARLEGATLKLPALRDCIEIVPELFVWLFAQHAGGPPELTPGFVEELCTRDWPLNIRELETLARRLAVTFTPGSQLARGELESARKGAHARTTIAPSSQDPASARPENSDPPAPESHYDARDVQLLLQTLTRNRGNLSRAAAELGVTRQKAYRMLRAAKRGVA